MNVCMASEHRVRSYSNKHIYKETMKMEVGHNKSHGFLIMGLIFAWMGVMGQARVAPFAPSSTTKSFNFILEWKTVTRTCSTKPILAVNGEYPGPTIAVNEGDEVEIKVTNNVAYNTTVHWHGIKQVRTGWADGPAYITQCPIQTNQSYTYKFTVINQRGTLWWHAHLSWQRATVHGAFIIYPRLPYPFATPIEAEVPIILGEWWNEDVIAVEAETVMYGGGPNVSYAFTINGLPGPLYPCSVQDTFIQTVEYGKTYMLRIINAALNAELFFAIANHTLTVVEIDGAYVKQLATPAVMIAPGQTTTVLLTANIVSGAGDFTIAARPYVTAIVPFDNTTTVGFLHYGKALNTVTPNDPQNISLDFLPPMQDTAFNTDFSNKLRSLASSSFPCNVPQTVDKHLFLSVSLNLQNCPPNKICKGFFGKRLSASLNNQSFIRPPVSILESHYGNLTNGGLLSDFPENPTHPFNYTAPTPLDANMNSEFGTKMIVVPYGTNLEFVLQDTSFINVENHPIHIHGHNFFIVGSGFGNFNSEQDPAGYNLVDPPERNTVAVPSGGWAAIRFQATNPGVWFLHCHLEVHTTWGLATAYIVSNGPEPSQSILPPPKDLPQC